MYCNRIAIMRFTNTSITTRNYRLFLWGKHLRYSLSATFKYIVWSFYRLTGLKGILRSWPHCCPTLLNGNYSNQFPHIRDTSKPSDKKISSYYL